MNRLRVLFPLVTLVAPLALGAPGAAWAQLASNSKAPIDVVSDEFVAEQGECKAVYKGAAEALQDTARLRADTISLFSKPGPAGGSKCGQLDHMVADGSVFYVTVDQVVKGDHAVWSADSKTITVTGQVVVAKGKDVMAGTRLVINTDLGQATMESTGKGRGAKERVRSVIYPKEGQSEVSSQPGLAAPVPPPPRQHGG